MVVDFDPVALALGPLKIHWYALAYLTGFFGGYAYIKWMIKTGKTRLTILQLDDLLSAMIIGVLLGGRLGYVLFYNLSYYIQKPLEILYLWQGGMSFHGAFIGIVISTFIYAKRQKLDPYHIGDLLGAVAPIGLFFGRLTNFVNGELYGRPTHSSIGMIFPRAGDNIPRFPSQIFEALSEGLLLFTVLWFAITYTRMLEKRGQIASLFIMGYAMCRFMVEFFREPDAQLGFLYAGATMGQVLSLPMALGGFWIFWRSRRAP